MLNMDVREYFLINRRGTILSVSEDLGEDEESIEASFEYWKNKGKLRQLGTSSCSTCSPTCTSCGSASSTTTPYEWMD